MHRAVLLILMMSAMAGCSDDATPDACCTDQPTQEPCAIEGVVVDETITPIEGVMIVVQDTEARATSGPNGTYRIPCLEPGTYFLEASHPLYGPVQASFTVAADATPPPLLKIQLQRIISTEPYTAQIQLAGYVFCSSSTATVISEECGEGLGVPGLGRVGGHPENRAQVDFFTDGSLLRSVVAELVWEPTLTVGSGVQEGQVHAGLFTEHFCDPICRYDALVDDKRGPSPLILRDGDGEQGGPNYFAGDQNLTQIKPTPETRFSVFVWASDEQDGILFEQPYEVLVTLAYVLPLPEGWSVVAGDATPF